MSAVTDAASFTPRVAPGSLATIFGTGLAASTAQASTVPLPTTLDATIVQVDGNAVPLVYVSATQIDFQVPSSLAAGDATVVVETAAGSSTAFTFSVVTVAPAIFEYSSNHAVAQNGDSAHTLNGSSSPAQAGSVITVYLTGQGAVDNAVLDGALTPASPLSTATSKATAMIGAQKATVQFLGLAPGFVGLAQANVLVPALPTGTYPLVISMGGTNSASAMVSVSGSGTVFTSPLALTGSVSFANSNSSSVTLLGNVAYICGAEQIVIVSVTDPTKPSVLGTFGGSALNGLGTKCALNDNTSPPLLVDILADLSSANPDPSAFAVFDLTNPTTPNFLGTTATTYPDIVNLSFNGPYGYATTNFITYFLSNFDITAQNGNFLSFDFTTPSKPAFLSMVQPNGAQPASSNATLKPFATVVAPTTAYITTTTATGTDTSGRGALVVVDISSPFVLDPLNEILASPANILLSFNISGNILLAAGNTAGQRNPGTPDFDFLGNLSLTTMDVTNIDSPVVIASYDTGLAVNGTMHVAAFANQIFALVNNPPVTDNNGPAALLLVDARTPQKPLLYPVETQQGFSGILATSGGYLLAPTSNGLNVYKLQLQ